MARFIFKSTMLLLSVLVVGISGGGCHSQPSGNPSFPLTTREAKQAILDMRHDPVMPERPIVVLGGIYDPGVVASALDRKIRLATHPDTPVVHVTFLGARTFGKCRDRVLDAVEEQLSGDDVGILPEVDVVAVSMGGLVARYAALPTEDDPRFLRIRNLYTMSSPHRGAALARISPFDKRARDMRAGSAFLEMLDDALPEAAYEIIPYTRLHDAVVGEENTAPLGQNPWWVPTPSFQFAHLTAFSDLRILADIMRRLRGETPYTIDPAEPLPTEDTP